MRLIMSLEHACSVNFFLLVVSLKSGECFESQIISSLAVQLSVSEKLFI